MLAELIRESSSAISVEYVRDLSIKGGSDASVVDYARKHHRIVVTTETGINHVTFPVCTHPGIIVLSGKRRHESIHANHFRKFLLSGHRQHAQDAVTFLTEGEALIRTHSEHLRLRID